MAGLWVAWMGHSLAGGKVYWLAEMRVGMTAETSDWSLVERTADQLVACWVDYSVAYWAE